MIQGLLLGAAAAFFWSLTNMVDKYLTKRHASDGNVWGILILSCLFPVILLPVALYRSPASIPLTDALILMTTGGLMTIWIYCYLKALVEDDTSIVMTLLVLAPFFSLLFSSLILGERLTPPQLAGGGLLLGGALLVSYNPQSNKINYRLLIFALTASVVMGLMHTLFKFVTVEEVFWQSVFWRSLGMVIIGIVLCIMFSHIRKRFIAFLMTYSRQGMTLNSTNESLTLAGDTVFGFAILFAPIALIQTTEAYQPIFIIIITTLLTKLGFDFAAEDNSVSSLIKKVIAIMLVIVGSFILVLNS